MSANGPSIRRRLIAALLGGIVVAVLAAAYGSYRLARREVDAVFDYHLKQLALSLRDHSFQNSRSLSVADTELEFMIQVWTRDGRPIYSSHAEPDLPLQAEPGFITIDTKLGRWRIYTAQVPDQVVQVAQPTRVRNELAAKAALRTVTPFLLLLPVLGAMIWWLVGLGLAPLSRLAHEVKRRSASQLQPLALADVPLEARPLAESLNGLLIQLDAALAAQRAFIADAAHELRTPLTALQLQAKLIERAQDDGERLDAVADLRRGLTRASHVVQQLLTLAREEPGDEASRPFARVDLVGIAGMAAADCAPLAEARRIDLGLGDGVARAEIEGDAAALRTMIGNLIENAILYTPAPGRVDVVVSTEGGRPLLTVADSGHGIPADECERVFDRFYRRAEVGESGSGLGLAIVKAIAARHHASVELGASPLGGLLVRVAFP